MAVREFTYKGKNVVVDQPDDQHADVKIEDRAFGFTQHGDPLPMWMCDHAYFAAPELEASIRHIIDYWYIFTDDEHRAPPVREGHGHDGGGKPSGKSKHDH